MTLDRRIRAWVKDYVAGLVGGGGVDHGLTTGLGDDDHLQYLRTDGTRGLSGDWDAGAHEVRAETFESDVAAPAAPMTIASNVMVANFNADLLDGNHAAAFAVAAQGVTNGNAHDHVGGDGAQIDHAGLLNLAVGDPHTQYLLESDYSAQWIPGPNRAVMWEDWFAIDYHGSHYWTRVQAGAGAATGCDVSEANEMGVLQAYTGSTATGYSHVALYTAILDPQHGGGVVTLVSRNRFSATVDGANEWWAHIGWGDNASGADETDGIYFRVEVLAAVVNIYKCVAGGGVYTKTAIFPAYAPNIWYEYKIVIDTAGTTAEFFIGGVSYGTITSADANYPAHGERCGIMWGITKTVGAASIKMWSDYVGVKKEFSTARVTW